MAQIKTVDELVEYASELAQGNVEYEPVVIDAEQLIVPLTVEGEGWDKRITATHARYIVSLQDELDALLKEYAPEILEGDEKPQIRAEVKDGSSKVLQDIKEIVTPLVNNMTDEQTFICTMTAIGAACGYFAWSRWLNYRAETKDKDNGLAQLAEHEETKRQMLQPLLEKANAEPETFSRYERPLHRLMKDLENDDSIALIGEGYIPAPQTTKLRPPRAKRSEKLAAPCDGEFQLTRTDYSAGEYILHLTQDGTALKAYTSALDNDDKKTLTQFIADKTNEEDAFPFAIPLQLTVEYTKKELKHGVILGLGEPRPNKEHKLLSELLD